MHYSNPFVTGGQKHTHTHTPDKLIKEDLQQPYRLKISFEEGSKDIKISLESYKPN